MDRSLELVEGPRETFNAGSTGDLVLLRGQNGGPAQLARCWAWGGAHEDVRPVRDAYVGSETLVGLVSAKWIALFFARNAERASGPLLLRFFGATSHRLLKSPTV